MTTNLSKVNSFILNSYIDTINHFVGEKIINEVDEKKASSLDSDTFKFFEKLAHRIVNTNKIVDTKSCSRNCIFRKVKR